MFAAFDKAGARILEAIARFLGPGTADFFVDTVRDGNSVMRLIHYPPVPEDSPAVRAGAHEDINTITLLIGAEEAGLELRTSKATGGRSHPRRANWPSILAICSSD